MDTVNLHRFDCYSMRCIFCKQDSSKSKTVEHIIPEALGNKKHVLPRGVVCDNCNRYFGLKVEKGRRKEDRIDVPVLFSYGGRIEKAFKADAHNAKEGVVLEVEAGRGVLNYQFLKDLFQACMMADIRYAFIAVVRNKYKNRDDFESVVTFLDTLYTSNRLQLPLEGVLIIGY